MVSSKLIVLVTFGSDDRAAKLTTRPLAWLTHDMTIAPITTAVNDR